MNLEEILKNQIEQLGQIRYTRSFGWICVYTGKNLFAGYKNVDNNILVMWLILSPDKFMQSLNDGFQKFNFGKTWAETEIIGEEDLPRITPYIEDAFKHSKTRSEKVKFKK